MDVHVGKQEGGMPSEQMVMPDAKLTHYCFGLHSENLTSNCTT